MQDYYSVLGLTRQASIEDVKKAYKRLAMQHHPDRGGDNEMFAKISEAYSVLSDETRKRQYDQMSQPGMFHNHTPFDLDDLFSMFANQGNPIFRKPTNSVRLHLWVDLRDLVLGGHRILAIEGPGGRTSNVEIEIPPGIEDGNTVRYKGMAPAHGDLLVTFRVKPNADWQRDGFDLKREVSVLIWDLILGSTVDIETLRGTKVSLTVPPRTQPGQWFRIKGHGLPTKTAGQVGDLLVRVNARLPNNISDHIIQAIQQYGGQ